MDRIRWCWIATCVGAVLCVPVFAREWSDTSGKFHTEAELVGLSGELETKSLTDVVVRLVERVEGTVGVDSKLTYRLDDTSLRAGLPPGAMQLSVQERRPA